MSFRDVAKKVYFFCNLENLIKNKKFFNKMKNTKI